MNSDGDKICPPAALSATPVARVAECISLLENKIVHTETDMVGFSWLLFRDIY